MRRSKWFRPLAVLLSLSLPFVLGSARGMESCVTQTVASARGASSAAAPCHHGKAAADVQSASGHPMHDSAPMHGHAQCTCIGCCPACTSLVLAAGHATSVRGEALTASDRWSFSEPSPRVHSSNSRPYPTGPPAPNRGALA